MNAVGEDVLTAAVSALKKSQDAEGHGSLAHEPKEEFFSSMLGRLRIGPSAPAPTRLSLAPAPVMTGSAGQTGAVAEKARSAESEPLANKA